MKCKQCEKGFKPKREWQVFCGNSCKCKYNRNFKEICFYCGAAGNHRDHVHPVSARGEARRYARQELVYACFECNVLLGSKVFNTIEDRVDYLVQTIIKRYKLSGPVVSWTEKEIKGLGPSLRAAIREGLQERHEAEMRVMYLKKVKEEMAGLLTFTGSAGDQGDCYVVPDSLYVPRI